MAATVYAAALNGIEAELITIETRISPGVGSNKSLRDLLGIRINLYFVDDQKILLKYLKDKYRAQFFRRSC